MNRLEVIFWCLCITVVFQNSNGAEHVSKYFNGTLRVDIARGIAMHIANNEASITLSMSSLLKDNGVEERSTGRLKFKKGILKRIGMVMMMAPLLLQLAWLPGTLASIKMSLLRSIFVGKIALAVMLYNALRNSQKSEVVVIHKPEYHEHYYHAYHGHGDEDGDCWYASAIDPVSTACHTNRRTIPFSKLQNARCTTHTCIILEDSRGFARLLHSTVRSRSCCSAVEMFSTRTTSKILCFLCAIFLCNFATSNETNDEARPYEFSFNIVDFQHRYEKKDTDGIITGEYGFITADGVYHETGYATDKNGDFLITRMAYRRIKSLKDAQEIFKDRPEVAKKLVEAVAARACSSCKVAAKTEKSEITSQITPTVTPSISQRQLNPLLQKMTKSSNEKKDDELVQERNKIPLNPKDLRSNERQGKSLTVGIVRNMVDSGKNFITNKHAADPIVEDRNMDDRALEKMANDLYYRFNYTITSHGHQEDGYRSGRKDGSYRSQSDDGVDTRVKYLSNEFGHQPNVSFVANVNEANETERLKGYSFRWYWSGSVFDRFSSHLFIAMRISVSTFLLLGLALYIQGEPIESKEENGSLLDCVLESNSIGCLGTRLARNIDQIEMQVTGKKSETPMSMVIEQAGNFVAEVIDDVQNPGRSEEVAESADAGEQGENSKISQSFELGLSKRNKRCGPDREGQEKSVPRPLGIVFAIVADAVIANFDTPSMSMIDVPRFRLRYMTLEGRGKKYGRKKKKQLQKLLGLAMLFKAKLSLLLQLISTHFQLKFFGIAILSLIINATKFWLDLKKSHPSKVIYYEHAQHQHHYDHDDYDHGYWGRSTNDSPQDLAYAAHTPKN
ncbi:Protein lethal(3)malignant blood neoplasm 1 [Eufriesea mexicana]|uniref:Protein lethal(3)malignant blood neoplasm 1 n=1 Tax=Eufriesea mexicana TaxID=516756 RepID=A0A310SGM6_9HYME|nr:Protein lethal(3)malignant blood neoplasm 1 [Eufriesea mexicana]